MSEITITDRALLRIVQRLGYTTTTAVALEPEPRRGFLIGEDLARRRLRELAQRGLARVTYASKYEKGGIWSLTPAGELVADAPATERRASASLAASSTPSSSPPARHPSWRSRSASHPTSHNRRRRGGAHGSGMDGPEPRPKGQHEHPHTLDHARR